MFPHAHVQIEYDWTESLIGFNPENKEDRELCHEMLDEYLNVLVERRKKMIEEGISESEIHGNGFQVFSTLDTH